MNLRKCRSCSYWVLPETRACPNCGAYAPASETSPFERDLDEIVRFVATLLFALAGVAGGFFYGRSGAPDDLAIAVIWGLSGLLVGWLVGDFLGGLWSRAVVSVRDRFFPTHSRESFRTEEERVRRALAELARRKQVIRGAKQQVSREPATKDLRAASKALDKGARTVNQEAAALQCRLWEITAERWENQFEWLSADPLSLSFQACAVRLQALSASSVRMESLLRNWERSVYATTEQGRACINRMRALMARRWAVKAALLTRTSAQAVQGVVDPRHAAVAAEEAVVRRHHTTPTHDIDMQAEIAASPEAAAPPAEEVHTNGVGHSHDAPPVQRTRRRLV